MSAGHHSTLHPPAILAEHATLRRWIVELQHRIAHVARRLRTGIAELVRWLRAITPAQWFLLGFALLFVAYAIVLLTAPSAVGRGGR